MGPSSSPFSLLLVLFAVGSFARYVVAQETGTGGVKGISKIPRTAPVFNKTPYFGGWVTSEGANANASVVGTTMRTWNGQPVDWVAYVRVDGRSWKWMGSTASDVASVVGTGTMLTATRSIFTMDVGDSGVSLNVTFFSPVESDPLQQSIPFVYVSVEATSKIGKAHSIQYYMEVGPSFITGTNETVEWSTGRTERVLYHRMVRSTPVAQDVNEYAENASLYFATGLNPETSVTYQTGGHSRARQTFLTYGSLDNTEDKTFRPAKAVDYPVLALAVDLGTWTGPCVWALGHTREDSLITSYDPSPGAAANATEKRVSLYRTKYATASELLDDIVPLDKFTAIDARGWALDETLRQNATRFTADYAGLVMLSLRQTMAGIEFAARPASGGSTGWNATDIYGYMKDVGVSKRVNPVEVMYAAMPTLLVINPKYIFYLLRPMLDFGLLRSKNDYAPPDLGLDYPNAVGNDADASIFGIDNSASMLLLAIAGANYTGEWETLRPYESLLDRWGKQVASLAWDFDQPSMTGSIDGVAGGHLANRDLKAILCLYEMGLLAKHLPGSSLRSVFYMSAHQYLMENWLRDAIAPDGHIISNYGGHWNESWTLGYNGHAAQLFGSPPYLSGNIWNKHSRWVDKELDKGSPFGIPVESLLLTVAKSHWTMFAAAVAWGSGTRDALIKQIHKRAFDPTIPSEFSTTYNAQTGEDLPEAGKGSPAQGAMFALLAAQKADDSFEYDSNRSRRALANTTIKIVLGVLVGAMTALAVWGCGHVCRRHLQRHPITWQDIEDPRHFFTTRWPRFRGETRIIEVPVVRRPEDDPVPEYPGLPEATPAAAEGNDNPASEYPPLPPSPAPSTHEETGPSSSPASPTVPESAVVSSHTYPPPPPRQPPPLYDN